jgi:predicted RNA polymerase sigma factor
VQEVGHQAGGQARLRELAVGKTLMGVRITAVYANRENAAVTSWSAIEKAVWTLARVSILPGVGQVSCVLPPCIGAEVGHVHMMLWKNTMKS